MENTEETRTCGQCNKQVAAVNFALHETHCSRFLCICPDCDESVPREQLSAHKEEQHTQVRCSKCNKKMERCHLLDHETDECMERLQSCLFCELEMPFKDLDEHSLACGSRTELCRECGRYITLRDQPQHALTCSDTDNASSSPPQTINKPPNNTKRTVDCRVCKVSFPVEDVEEHELECFLESKREVTEAESKQGEGEEEKEGDGNVSEPGSSPRLSSTYRAKSRSEGSRNGPWGNGGDPDQISTCPHCHLALPLITLLWHEAKCRVHVHFK
ncbi:XIAP-associated factor 1 [Notolabrus celidotus]|uniref:XIAP-associated factor 1 n=1 Tax=Notolabrus celidotus TaxID=1203425 RepID=UPI0014900D54|nr:XIAP-associated factor 1 [Notolabrus celidotus]